MRDAQRERDEAQKEAARLKRWIYRTRKESLENKGEEITDDPASLLHSMFYEIVDGRVDRLESFRRGAEAMREACAREVVDGRLGVSSDDMAWLNDIASDLRDLPIPEEP
jgi:hypothetical protein